MDRKVKVALLAGAVIVSMMVAEGFMLSESETYVHHSMISVDVNGNVHVIWIGHQDEDENVRLLYRSKIDGQWMETETIQLFNRSAPNLKSFVADDQGNIHLTWISYNDLWSPNGTLVYLIRSDGNWSQEIKVNPDDHVAVRQSAFALGWDGTAHFVWNNVDIYTDDLEIMGSGLFYRNFTDGIWSEPEVVATDFTWKLKCPDMAVDDNNRVHVVWNQGNAIVENFKWVGWNETLYYTSGSNGIWQEKEVVNEVKNVNRTNIPNRHISTDSNGYVHIMWIEIFDAYPYGYTNIYYAYKNDSWAPVKLMSNHEGFGHWLGSFNMVIDSKDNVHMSWIQRIESEDHDFVVYYYNDGDEWSDMHALFKGASESQMAVDSNDGIHFVYTKDDNSWQNTGHRHLYYSYKPAGGEWV